MILIDMKKLDIVPLTKFIKYLYHNTDKKSIQRVSTDCKM